MGMFLYLISQVYKYGFLLVAVITAIMMVFGSDPAGVTLGKGIEVLAFPFVWFAENIMLTLIEWFMVPVIAVSDMDKSGISGLAWLLMFAVSAMFSFIGVITTVVFFPVVLLMFPIWTIFDKEMAQVWEMYLNPVHVVSEVTIPLMAEIQNSADMQHSNPVIRQMAINDDLADRITGRMMTKQSVVEFITDKGYTGDLQNVDRKSLRDVLGLSYNDSLTVKEFLDTGDVVAGSETDSNTASMKPTLNTRGKGYWVSDAPAPKSPDWDLL